MSLLADKRRRPRNQPTTRQPPPLYTHLSVAALESSKASLPRRRARSPVAAALALPSPPPLLRTGARRRRHRRSPGMFRPTTHYTISSTVLDRQYKLPCTLLRRRVIPMDPGTALGHIMHTCSVLSSRRRCVISSCRCARFKSLGPACVG